MPYGLMVNVLEGVSRCPHCGVASPLLVCLWKSEDKLQSGSHHPTARWALYLCTRCGNAISAKGDSYDTSSNPIVVQIFPDQKEAHEDLPAVARQFLQQAYETLHAPDAAAVMAGSAVDAMLKEVGYQEGSLYTRIDKAVEDHILTSGMGDWAHEVRLGSNRPRHADEGNPHVSLEEAAQSVDFAEALGNFLFVLTARIVRGLDEARRD